MRYKEVIHVTDKEFHGAYFRTKEKGFPETLGCRLGKTIADRQSYNVDIREDGSRVYSLEVLAFSPERWRWLLRELADHIPAEILGSILYDVLEEKLL